MLFVNGQEVINRSDVFYRDTQSTPHPSPTSAPHPSPSASQPASGGLLDGIIGGLLGGLGDVFYHVASPQTWDLFVMPNGLQEGSFYVTPAHYDGSQTSSSRQRRDLLSSYVMSPFDENEALLVGASLVPTPTTPPTTETTALLAAPAIVPPLLTILSDVVELMQQPKTVGFSGLFFRYACFSLLLYKSSIVVL